MSKEAVIKKLELFAAMYLRLRSVALGGPVLNPAMLEFPPPSKEKYTWLDYQHELSCLSSITFFFVTFLFSDFFCKKILVFENHTRPFLKLVKAQLASRSPHRPLSSLNNKGEGVSVARHKENKDKSKKKKKKTKKGKH